MKMASKKGKEKKDRWFEKIDVIAGDLMLKNYFFFNYGKRLNLGLLAVLKPASMHVVLIAVLTTIFFKSDFIY